MILCQRHNFGTKKKQGDTLYRSELANVMKKEGGGSQTKVGGFLDAAGVNR